MWPLYNIVSRFLHSHLHYMQTKLSGLDITQGGSVDLEVDKGDAGDAPSDPQGEKQNDMDVEEGKQHENENETDVEEDNGMDAEDGEHDSQTDKNTISPQVPVLEKHAPKKGLCLDPDSQAVGGPSQSRQADLPPPSQPGPSKAPSTTKTLEKGVPIK